MSVQDQFSQPDTNPNSPLSGFLQSRGKCEMTHKTRGHTHFCLEFVCEVAGTGLRCFISFLGAILPIVPRSGRAELHAGSVSCSPPSRPGQRHLQPLSVTTPGSKEGAQPWPSMMPSAAVPRTGACQSGRFPWRPSHLFCHFQPTLLASGVLIGPHRPPFVE